VGPAPPAHLDDRAIDRSPRRQARQGNGISRRREAHKERNDSNVTRVSLRRSGATSGFGRRAVAVAGAPRAQTDHATRNIGAITVLFGSHSRRRAHRRDPSCVCSLPVRGFTSHGRSAVGRDERRCTWACCAAEEAGHALAILAPWRAFDRPMAQCCGVTASRCARGRSASRGRARHRGRPGPRSCAYPAWCPSGGSSPSPERRRR